VFAGVTSKAEAFAAYDGLVAAFADGPIITTNWDTIMDRSLWGVDPSSASCWEPRARRVCYSPVAEIIVDFYSRPVDWPQHPQLP